MRTNFSVLTPPGKDEEVTDADDFEDIRVELLTSCHNLVNSYNFYYNLE